MSYADRAEGLCALRDLCNRLIERRGCTFDGLDTVPAAVSELPEGHVAVGMAHSQQVPRRAEAESADLRAVAGPRVAKLHYLEHPVNGQLRSFYHVVCMASQWQSNRLGHDAHNEMPRIAVY